MSTCRSIVFMVCGVISGFANGLPQLNAAPRAESFLIEGKLTEGAETLQSHLNEQPADDEARFGLGVIQFFQAFEHLTNKLYQYGLRTEDALRGQPNELRNLFPQNRNPETLSYQAAREMLNTFVSDINTAEQTLSAVKDDSVELLLHVGQIKVDLTGQGKLIHAGHFLGPDLLDGDELDVKYFKINFDRGDVDWLAGYCNFLSAWGEILLAVETKELFECTAHLFFQDIDTPHEFLLEGKRDFNSVRTFNRPLVSDIIAYLHLWRFSVNEPHRMQAALKHLEGMQEHAVSMWKHYRVETDDDREWIPNPQQTGVLQVQVTEEMLQTWLKILAEADLILKGEKLIPFWRKIPPSQGVNFRRIFTEPTTLDPFLWWQGTAATAYLEEGTMTDLADPEMQQTINQTFGRMNFFWMALWFN